MAKINVDFDKIIGKIKPLHAGGQLDVSAIGYSDFKIFSDIGVPYSRLHDVFGSFGGGRYVDIPNIFRDFSADENDPESYDFAFTDRLLEDLVAAGIEPYFRLGVTIENAAKVKPYHIVPPSDYTKWARVCEHIMAHYLRGWANGYNYKITYWEIWNEPDNNGYYEDYHDNQMWTGTKEEYYEFYDVVAKHLKKEFPDVKIGGYASCGFYILTSKLPDTPQGNKRRKVFEYYLEFFRGFINYVKDNNSPLDFFSWHSYADTKTTLVWADFLKEELRKAGFGDLPTHINEWNPFAVEHGTAHHSAEVASMMLAMQNKDVVQLMCIYDMRPFGTYAAIFDGMKERPTYSYYSFAAFNALYKLGNQVKLESDTDGIYAVAATDGKRKAIMISNISGETQNLEIEGAEIKDARYYVLADDRMLSWAADAKQIENNAVVLIEF